MAAGDDGTARARRLLAALLWRATRDAESGDPFLAANGRRFLQGEGSGLAEMLDVDPERVRVWLEGLPEVEDLARCHYAPGKAADLLGVSLATLREWKAAGLVPDAPGGRYSARALLEFLCGEDEHEDGDD